MTPAEYQALTSPRLSHPARSLYLLHLRHQARGDCTPPLDYPSLGKALAVQKDGGYQYRVTPLELTALLDELQAAGLLSPQEKPHSQHYHGATFMLPLKRLAGLSPLPPRQFAMHPEWRPDPQLDQLARLCGLLDSHFDEAELGEFIAYWLGRPEAFANQHQWTLKFVRQLKSQRSIRRAPAATAVTAGYQQQPAKTETGPSKRAREMMEEARRLGGGAHGEHDEEDA